MKFSLFSSLYRDVLFITHFYNTSPFLMTSACAVEKSRQGQLYWHFRQHNQKKSRAATAESEYGELCDN
jgi:hypothetical protein